MVIVQTINQFQRKLPVWPFYVAFGLVPLWWLYLGITGGLGAEPIKALEHLLGLIGLQVLIASLAVTPLRTHLGINLIRFRRMLGLVTFYFIAWHFCIWFFLDVQIPSQVWADILKRPYITIGMAALVLMTPLALTSSNLAIRKIGPVRWRQLHKLVYLVAILGGVHFVMLTKTWQMEPILYLLAIATLLALRLRMPTILVRALSSDH